jgi:hypothetical protein
MGEKSPTGRGWTITGNEFQVPTAGAADFRIERRSWKTRNGYMSVKVEGDDHTCEMLSGYAMRHKIVI